MKVTRNRALLVVLSVLVFIVLALPVAAHEGREVGDYVIEFGWRVEPAFAGLMNGPEVYVNHHDSGEPVEGASLQVEVTFGSERMTMPLEAAWGETGRYIADLIPTLPGDYVFRVFGTIGEVEVDESFDSADGEFSTVEPAADIMFPTAGAVDSAALLARIEALEARIAELEAGA